MEELIEIKKSDFTAIQEQIEAARRAIASEYIRERSAAVARALHLLDVSLKLLQSSATIVKAGT